MKTSNEKEKKLVLALSKLKNLNHKNPGLTNALQNLDNQKNQLEIEKKEIETKYENLNPSLEPSHAFAEAIKIAPKLSKDTVIIVNSCGDAQKDRDILKQRLGN